ncbi:MAG TPA: O-acetyl-ADP-ribose deacetylase [Pyrinomonadaceae bacterium]
MTDYFSDPMEDQILHGRLTVRTGDITDEAVDAIVNAANSTLLGGGGVDGAIHRRGGSAILEECKAIRQTQFPDGLPIGEAVITTGGDLPARYVIHTVGPIYGMSGGRDAELLAGCYRNSVGLAAAQDLATISFPSISTGAYGFPKHEAAPVVYRTLVEVLERHSLIHVALVFFTRSDASLFLKHYR